MTIVNEILKIGKCGKDYDHDYGDGEDRDSSNNLTYVCKNCGHTEKAPIGYPPNKRT
jgi:hypothetical protein